MGRTDVRGGRILVGDIAVHGLLVDAHTRCEHYHGDRDVIAIRFRCCGRYYPCHLCHDAVAGHEARRWPRDRRQRAAILCGMCAAELTIAEYVEVDACPRCGAGFNEGCRLHHHLYFE
ncbi:MAG: CHY zinc finger protein [Microbacterium sp.]